MTSNPIASNTRAVSLTEFVKDPAAALREANGHPVTVLALGEPAFYVLAPDLFETLLEDIGDGELAATVLARLGEKTQAVEVDINRV